MANATTLFSQSTQCLDSKWRFFPSPDIYTHSKLEWLEKGFVAINGWGPGSNSAILTLHSTFKPAETTPSYTNIPATLKFVTETIIAGLQRDHFGKSSIDFHSVSNGGFNWQTAKIETIDLLGGDYNNLNLTRTVKAGMSFSCAGGPTLNEALGSTREVFRIINGNMGIGCLDPLDKFEVQPIPGTGNGTKITIGERNFNPSIRLYRRNGLPCSTDQYHEQAYPWWIELNDDWQTTGVYGALFFKSKDGVGQCSNGTEDVETKVAFLRNGNVGIGEINPRERLVVKGKVCAQEVRVSLDGDPCWWPDFVFSENYKLLSLEEIEKFVKSNKHLPDVPSSEEVSKNGIELGEKNAILLRKIEELTLHLIQLKKENEEIKKYINKE